MATMQHFTSVTFADFQDRAWSRRKTTLPNVETFGYESLVELKDDLGTIADDGRPLTVVLALHRHFNGDLTALVNAAQSAERVIVTTADGSIPGDVFLGPLATGRQGTVRANVEFNHDAAAALADLLQGDTADHRNIVFWPEWIDRQPILRVI